MYGNLLIIEGDTATPVPQRTLGRAAGDFNEHWLRDRLFAHPEALPLAGIDASYADSVPICRELRTTAGPIDALFANKHGLLTVLECKLWRNPEARREVVGQVLDYARALAGLSYEDLSIRVNAALRSEGNRLFNLVRERHPELTEHTWVDQVSRNLAQGRFLLLVAGDGIREGVVAITEQLQRGVGLRFHFGLVEVAVFVKGGLTILQPRLLARTFTVERSVVRVDTSSFPSATTPNVSIVDADEFVAEADAAEPELVLLRRNFWTEFVAKVRLEGGIDVSPKRLQQNSARARLPLGQWITAYRSESLQRIGLWFEARGEQAAEISRHFARNRTEIESEIGLPVTWERRDGGVVIVDAQLDQSNFESPEALTEQQQWLGDHLKAFTRALGPRLRAIEENLQGGD